MAFTQEQLKAALERKRAEREARAATWTGGNVVRQVLGQGLGLGWGDEAEGLVRGIGKWATTDTPFREAVGEGIDYSRAQNEAFEAQNPKSSLALQVGGGLLAGGVGGARALGAKGLTLGAKMARGAKFGTGVGAVAGAGYSEGAPAERIIPALGGAALGGGIGAAMPVAAIPVMGAVKGIAARFTPRGAQRQADTLLQDAFEKDQITKDLLESGLDANRAAGGVVADVGVPIPGGGGRTSNMEVQKLARYAAAAGDRDSQRMLEARQAGQGERITDAIDSNISPSTIGQFIRKVTKQRRIRADEDYKGVYKTEVELTDELKDFFRNTEVQEAYKGAQKIAAAEGHTLLPLTETIDGQIIYNIPTARGLDIIKRSLDDMVEKAHRTGENQYRVALQTLRDDFKSHLDDIIPGYRDARGAYAGSSAALEAAESGKNLVTKPSVDITLEDITEMGPHEREGFLAGVASALRYISDRTADGNDKARKLIGNKYIRDRIRLAFGGDEAAHKAFVARIETEAALFKTYGGAMRGSRTTPMEMDKAAIEGGAAAIDLARATAGDPAAALRAANAAFGMFGAPPGRVADRLQPMLYSQDPADQKMVAALLGRKPRPYSQGAGGGMVRALFTPATAVIPGKELGIY